MTTGHDVSMKPMSPQEVAGQFSPQIQQQQQFIPQSTPQHIVLPRQVVDYALVYLADRKGPGDLIYQSLLKAVDAVTPKPTPTQ